MAHITTRSVKNVDTTFMLNRAVYVYKIHIQCLDFRSIKSYLFNFITLEFISSKYILVFKDLLFFRIFRSSILKSFSKF